MSTSKKIVFSIIAIVTVAIGGAGIGGLMYLGAPAPRGLDRPELTVTILTLMMVAKILSNWWRDK